MVISTGMTLPRWFSVAALYCLQNSMVCTPWGPRAVPTGGAGVACPAGSWILTMAATRFFAMGLPLLFLVLELRDLCELELDRGLPAEDVDEHLELELVLVDLGDLAGEVGEGAFLDPHALAHFVLEAGAGPLCALRALGRHLQQGLDAATRQRRRLRAEADEPGDAGRVPHDVPRVVVELAAHERVAGEHLLRDDDLLAVLELDDVLDRDDDLEDPVLHVHGGDPALEVGLHLVLVAGVRVNHEPLARTVVRALDEDDVFVV